MEQPSASASTSAAGALAGLQAGPSDKTSTTTTTSTDPILYALQCDKCATVFYTDSKAEHHADDNKNHVSFYKLSDAEIRRSQLRRKHPKRTLEGMAALNDAPVHRYPESIPCPFKTSDALAEQERLDEAEAALQQQLAAFGISMTPDVLTVMHDVAVMRHRQKDHRKAEELLEDLLTKRESILGNEHVDTLKTLSALGLVLNDTDRFDEALEKHEMVLDVLERDHGKEEPFTIETIANLARTAQQCEQFYRAETLFRRALSRSTKALGEEHPTTIDITESLAKLMDEVGEYAEAETWYRTALKLREHAFGEKHLSTIECVYRLARNLHIQSRPGESEMLFRRAREFKQRFFENYSTREVIYVTAMGVQFENQDKFRVAEAMYLKALDLKRRKTFVNEYMEDDFYLAALMDLGSALQGQLRYTEAEPVLEHCMEMSEKMHGPDSLKTLGVAQNLSGGYAEIGRWDLAEPLGIRVVQGREKHLGKNDLSTIDGLYNLTNMYKEQVKVKKARETAREALKRIAKLLKTGTLEYRQVAKLRQFEGNLRQLDPEYLSFARRVEDGQVVSDDEEDDEEPSYTDQEPWLGAALPQGYVDLNHMIQKSHLEALNTRPEFGSVTEIFQPSPPVSLPKGAAKRQFAQPAVEDSTGAKSDFVVSDVDEQLMIFIRFISPVKVFSLQFTSFRYINEDDDEVSRRPKTIKLYVNAPQILDFEDSVDPTQELEIGEKDWDEATGTATVNMRFVKFQSVGTLTVFVVDGVDEEVDGKDAGEFTRVDRIRVIGKPGVQQGSLATLKDDTMYF
ncbi:Nephrocystin-3 [Drechslerella dactyloides]|uniref:Nephrocystin-3 n=1 Tax=Drechslerella dactyloides TaxID=74499 RepID=A0AAD6NJA2_DREDA|nr:Nephrocystin-3 [Drechslerella dactyloides]